MKDDAISPCKENCSFCFLNYADILGENYLFRNLNPIEIGAIIRNVHHQVKKAEKGQIIAYAGDPCCHLMIIVKGAVVGEIIDFEGKVLRVEHLKAPDTIASAFIFGETTQFPVNVTALEDTKLLLIPREDLLKIFKEYEIVMTNFIDILANRTQNLTKKLKMVSMQSIKGKLAYYLLDLTKKQKSHHLVLPNTQQELAEIFGVIRPSLSRALREMHEKGFIQAKGKNIFIKDHQALSTLLR